MARKENNKKITAPEPTETKAADISADEIIANYVKALGGADAINAIKDYKITGTMSVSGQNLNVTQMFKQPDMTSMLMGMGGVIVQRVAFDGQTLRMSGMGGNQEFTEGTEFENAKAEAGVAPPMNFAAMGYKMTVKGIEKIGDKEVFVVVVETGTVKTYYFDTHTGLLLRVSTIMDTPQGEMQMVTDYSDYRPVNGVLFPHKQTVAAMGMEVTVNSIEVNTGLADEDFK